MHNALSRVWLKRLVPVALAIGGLSGCAIPLVSETELAGQSAKEFEKIKQEKPVSRDARTRSYVNCVADAIVAQLPAEYASKSWTVEVFDAEEVNAFAMPGGKIGVFTGLLAVAENQDQLGAVLGHEVAHVTQKHALGRVNRELTTRAGVVLGTVALGGGQGMADLLGMGAQLGLSLPYGRSQESEADVVGLKFSAAAGFDPRQSIELWKNMKKKNKLGPPQFLSTHPSDENRIADLTKQLAGALPLYNQAQQSGRKPRCQK